MSSSSRSTIWVLVLCCFALAFGANLGRALKLPFRANDVLPVLPRQISWPVLNNLHTAVDLLPSYVGSVTPSNGTIEWKGACFFTNEAQINLTEGDRGLGGGVLRLKTSAAHSWTCMDLYVFATPYRITWDYYFSAREHTLMFDSWEEPAELEYVKQHGISVFLMPSGMLGTLLSLVDVLPLFSNTVWGENANLAFLKKHMGATFEKRSQPWKATINPDDVHSGDFLAVSKIRGRWGGFETLEKWVTGSFAGHTAVCLKDEQGNLWVGESGHENEKGEEIIVVIPWDEWWELALKDNSNPQVALLPLHPQMRAKFNSSAAWEYARSMSGKPYGYHNMIFSWIDTVTDNFPPPLDAHLVISVMSMWTRLQPAYAANMWNEALNKRLGTEDLDLHDILVETEKRGIPFDELLTIPEQDDWVYSDGKSTTCVAFILAMYKEAGIFGPVSSSIQVTEFTIRDAYMLKIFEDNHTRLSGDKQPIQIRTRKFIRNALLARKQFLVDVIHPGRPNVSRNELQEKLAQLFKINEVNRVFVFGFRTVFGGGRSSGFALIYDTLEAAKKFEPKFRLARNGLAKKREGSRKQIKEKKNRGKKVWGLGRRLARHKAKKADA